VDLDDCKLELANLIFVNDKKINDLLLINGFDCLRKKSEEDELILENEQVKFSNNIFNFSERVLTENEKSVLNKGLKFGIKSKVDVYEILCNFEILAQKLNKIDIVETNADSDLKLNAKDDFNTKMKEEMLGYIKACKRAEDSLTSAELNLLTSLSKDKSLVISKADKGDAVVIQNRKDYDDKMLKLLSDKSKFKELDLDPTIDRLKHLNSKVYSLQHRMVNGIRAQALDNVVYERIYTAGAKPGVLYGLPKVHKENLPIRPIISAIGTYNYNLAKWLDEIIKPFVDESKYLLKDTFDFVNKVKLLNNTEVGMGSFDVESLFTNVPLEETIDILISKIFKDKKSTFHGLKHFQFRDLMIIATQQSHFQFLGKFYDQIDGVAMGSPLGPTLANIFMNHLEEKFVNQVKTTYGVLIWLRYVDDIFILIKDLANMDKVLNFINNFHKNIKFTYEIEKDFILPFLDVKILRRENVGFIISVYRKKTFTGVYLNWNSLTSRRYKIGLIKCLLNRAWRICSDLKLFHLEVLKVKIILRKNNYPNKVIDREVERFINDRYTSIQSVNEEDKKIMFLSLPYFGNFAEDFKLRFTNTVKTSFPKVDLKIVFKAPKTIGNLFSFKDKTPHNSQFNIIYQLTCEDCKKRYIGKTTRNFCVRLDEHLSENKKNDSSVIKHIRNNNHTMKVDWDLLDKANSNHKLLLKEMLYINRVKPELNVQEQSELFCLLIGKTKVNNSF
jgi:hypothetical protein